MKKIITIAFLMLSQSTWALSYRAFCSGNRGRVSISIYSSKAQDKIFFHYTNAFGAQDFPFYEGVVTPSTMPFIKMAQQELSSIDGEALVAWPLEKCHFSTKTPLLMSCEGVADFITPIDSKLQTSSFSTNLSYEEGLNSHFAIFKVRWGIDGDSLHHALSLPFNPEQCKAEYVP